MAAKEVEVAEGLVDLGLAIDEKILTGLKRFRPDLIKLIKDGRIVVPAESSIEYAFNFGIYKFDKFKEFAKFDEKGQILEPYFIFPQDKFTYLIVCKKCQSEDCDCYKQYYLKTGKKRKSKTPNLAVKNIKNQESVEEMDQDVPSVSAPDPSLEIVHEDPKSPAMLKAKPVFVKNVNCPIEFSKILSEKCSKNFSIKILGQYCKVFPESLDVKNNIVEFLKNEKFEFFISPEGTPSRRAVIKGLPKSTKTSDIVEKLNELGFDASATQMKSKVDGRTLPLFLICVPKNAKAKELFTVRSLFNIRIEVQEFRAPKRAPQCFNCQAFFHVAKHCFMNPRCVGCGANHPSSECPRKVSEETKKTPPSCCNCNQSHPANYRGCSKFPLKPQFRKSFAEVLKNKASKPIGNKPTSIKPIGIQSTSAQPIGNQVAASQPMAKRVTKLGPAQPASSKNPPKPVQIYREQELGGDLSNLVDVIQKIKAELQISSFSDLASQLEKIYSEIIKENDVAKKRLHFMDGVSRLDSGKITSVGGSSASST